MIPRNVLKEFGFEYRRLGYRVMRGKYKGQWHYGYWQQRKLVAFYYPKCTTDKQFVAGLLRSIATGLRMKAAKAVDEKGIL